MGGSPTSSFPDLDDLEGAGSAGRVANKQESVAPELFAQCLLPVGAAPARLRTEESVLGHSVLLAQVPG